MAAYIKQNRVELLKFAAACSGKQQPNDVMRGFLVLKRLLRSLSFKYGGLAQVKEPNYMPKFKAFIKNESTMDLGERSLLFNFMAKLPQVLRKSLPPKTIEDGYAGLVPYDELKILNQCLTWKHYDPQTQAEIVTFRRSLGRNAS
jgi:hypothetical protein